VPLVEDGMLVARDGRRLALDAEVPDEELVWVANEGIRVSALVASLAAKKATRPEEAGLLEKLLAATSDPLREVVEGGPTPPSAAAGVHSRREEPGAAPNVFHFTGAVTIVVGGSEAAIAAASRPSAAMPATSPAPTSTVIGDRFREKALRFDEDYPRRSERGYSPEFLGETWCLPLPRLTEAHHGRPLRGDDGQPWVIPYYHYSLVMNETRRLLAWAAANVDYSARARRFTRTRKEYGGESWRLDPRVALRAPGLQLEDADFYAPAKKIDRGHIVRREDSAWGASAKEAEFGNSDTYHWTNCTPQSEAFNQSGRHGLWGQFEEHIQAQVGALGGRMSVFAGPVLSPEDPEHGYEEGATIQVPMEYWKVVACVAREGGEDVRLAYGFVFDQTEPIQRLGYERMDMDDYEIYQMPLAEITRKTGVAFDESLLLAGVLREGGAPESIHGFAGKRISDLAEVVLR
jgi:endonuclease G